MNAESSKPESNKVLLIFDCDGVLVDSEPLSNRIFVQCLRDEGFDVDEAYGDMYFMGRSTRDCLTHLKDVFNREVSERFHETVAHHTYAEMKTSLQAIPKIKDALELLPYPRCVASGSEPERIQLSLEVTGLLPYFTHIYSSLEVARGKPFPDIFLHAANQLHVTPQQCIVIEDSNFGMQAALAAGMQLLLYRPQAMRDQNVPEDVIVFSDMAELPELVEKIVQSM